MPWQDAQHQLEDIEQQVGRLPVLHVVAAVTDTVQGHTRPILHLTLHLEVAEEVVAELVGLVEA